MMIASHVKGLRNSIQINALSVTTSLEKLTKKPLTITYAITPKLNFKTYNNIENLSHNVNGNLFLIRKMRKLIHKSMEFPLF